MVFVSAESQVTQVRDRSYFDRWYAEMATSSVKDPVLARHLGIPGDYTGSTGVLPWEALDEFAAQLRLAPGGCLADIACGRGGYGIELARRCGTRLLGVDFSAVALAHAEATAQKHLANGLSRFAVGTLTDTGLAANTADALVCTDSVQFAQPPAAALEEFRRVLVSGGRLALTTWQPIRPDPAIPARLRALHLRRDLESLGFVEIVLARRARWRAIERTMWEDVVSTPNDGTDLALGSVQAEARRSLEQFGSLQRIVVYATAP